MSLIPVYTYVLVNTWFFITGEDATAAFVMGVLGNNIHATPPPHVCRESSTLARMSSYPVLCQLRSSVCQSIYQPIITQVSMAIVKRFSISLNGYWSVQKVSNLTRAILTRVLIYINKYLSASRRRLYLWKPPNHDFRCPYCMARWTKYATHISAA